MFRIYCAIPNEKPVFLADFDAEEFAQILVDAGNKLYAGEREFYLEDSTADEVTDEPEDEICTENYRDGLARDFERTEAQAYNRELDRAKNGRV